MIEILPGKGFDSLRFGMSVTQAELALGRADGASVFDDGEEWTLILRYPGVDPFFDQLQDFRLTTLEVSKGRPYSLFGETLRSLRQSLDVLQRHLPEPAKIEVKRNEDLGEVSVNIPSLWLTLYFSLSNRWRGANWSAFVSGGEFVWPGLD